jgi:hypothetical protein
MQLGIRSGQLQRRLRRHVGRLPRPPPLAGWTRFPRKMTRQSARVRRADLECATVKAFGFAGQNACLVLRRSTPEATWAVSIHQPSLKVVDRA